MLAPATRAALVVAVQPTTCVPGCVRPVPGPAVRVGLCLALRRSTVLAPATRAALVVAVQPLKAKLPRGDPGWQANEFVIAIEGPLNALSFVGTVTGHVMRARRPGAQRFMHLPAEQPV